MSTPKRIQRKRTKGWRMPEGAVYVGRPSKWGNPYAVGFSGWCHAATRAEAVDRFRLWACGDAYLDAVRCELAGRDLACWCPLDQPCHADVLLEIANGSLR